MSFIVRRGGVAIVVLLLAVTLNFVVIRAAPGSYADVLEQRTGLNVLTPEAQAAIDKAYGLNESVLQQYLRYVEQTLKGNFGTSFTDGQPVGPKLWAATKNTIPMVLLGIIVGMIVGVLLGLIAGSRSGGLIDSSIVTFASVMYSLPGQLVGILLLVIFAGVLPSGGRSDPLLFNQGFWGHSEDVLKHMLLPSLTLALTTLGAYVLVTRSSMIQAMGEDFVLTARAKGYSRRRIVLREVFRTAVLPVAALAGLSFGFLLGGALLVEVVFSWPGLGLLAYNAITNRDYPVVQATFLIVTLGVVVMNFLVDCLYTVLDPRVRNQ
jgi:ABC-type dipeptide/oligopeptide/nickel transport system permease component